SGCQVAALLELAQRRVEGTLGGRAAAVGGPLDGTGDVVAVRRAVVQHLEDEETAERHLDGPGPVGPVREVRGRSGDGAEGGFLRHVGTLCLGGRGIKATLDSDGRLWRLGWRETPLNQSYTLHARYRLRPEWGCGGSLA